MRNFSTLHEHKVYIHTACIAAYAQYSAFRVRDVRFLVELFSNWASIASEHAVLELQNVQVKRFLDGLIENSLLRKVGRNRFQKYELNQEGLVYLLRDCVEESYIEKPEQFFYLHYFITNYRPLLNDLVKSASSHLSVDVQVELEELLNVRLLVEKEKRAIKKELRKVSFKIQRAAELSEKIAHMRHSGESVDRILESVGRDYPYELHGRKSLKDLLDDLPESVRMWELSVGMQRRAKQIWGPHAKMLEEYYKTVSDLECNQEEDYEHYPWK